MFIVAFASLGGSAEEFRKTFLIEMGGSYEVSVSVKTRHQNEPTQASLYLHNDHGEYLRSKQLTVGLGKPNEWQDVSVVFTTPPGAERATVVFIPPVGAEIQWKNPNIRRVESAKPGIISQGLIYTGLVIDARGLEIKRGISPRVFSQSGQLVYAGVTATPEYLQEVGVVAYGQELTQDLLSRIQPAGSAITVSPLLIPALEVTGSTETSVIISDDDTAKILDALNTYDFLAHYAVIFLID